MRIVIVGNGPAAVSAVEAIRHTGSDADIVMFGAESIRPYTPCFLSQYVSGRIGIDKLAMRPEDFYESARVELRAHERVVAVRPEAHEIETASGERLGYDRLLLASGAETVVPDIPGVRAPGVVGFRGLADAEEIRARLGGVRHAVVLGSGFVATEAAEALADSGVAVTLLARHDRILRRLFDAEVAGIVESALERHGVTVLRETGIARIDADAPGGGVSAVELTSGATLPCDLLVLAVGMKANTAIVDGSGIEVGEGILTDATMHSSAPDVWAAGDVAEPEIKGVRKLNLIHPNAVLTGKVAGLSIAGVERPMSNHFGDRNVLNVFGTSYLSVGAIAGDEVLARRGAKDDVLKITLDGGVVVGVQMVGNVARGGLYAGLIGRRLPDGVGERLLSDDFNFGDISTWPFAG